MIRSSLSSSLALVAATGIAATAAATVYACSDQPSSFAVIEQDESRPISRAVFADDRLWLLHDDGMLASLKPVQAKPENVAAIGKIFDICNSGSRLFALVGEGQNQWLLQQRGPEGWTVRVSVPVDGDVVAAMDCKRDAPDITLVTNRRIVEFDGKNTRVVKLDQELQPPLVNGTALATRNAVWIGFNVGEWGGGLRRISRNDGRVETVEYNKSGDLCGGPLNTACDPVNGIVVAPWNPACVVAAIGLVHFMPHGRIVEVCGNEVRRVYFKAFDPQPPRNLLDDGEPSSTVAFFGLAQSGNSIWAVGIDGLHRFEGQQIAEFRPLPKFENRGGYWVSFDVPGLALVMTDVNQRRSISGSVPIIAVR